MLVLLSKSMDLNDILIHSSALNIRLLRNVTTQSRGDRYYNWQLFIAEKVFNVL